MRGVGLQVGSGGNGGDVVSGRGCSKRWLKKGVEED